MRPRIACLRSAVAFTRDAMEWIRSRRIHAIARHLQLLGREEQRGFEAGDPLVDRTFINARHKVEQMPLEERS